MTEQLDKLLSKMTHDHDHQVKLAADKSKREITIVNNSEQRE